MSFVDPTWHTNTAGSACSSRYIVYSELPGAVFSTHGSALVPVAISQPSFPTAATKCGTSASQPLRF